MYVDLRAWCCVRSFNPLTSDPRAIEGCALGKVELE
jgi:hypothetical protein